MSELKKILEMTLAQREAGVVPVLSAVLSTTGSVPRTTGALMLSGPKGILAGTVGGGPLEHACLTRAAALTDPQGVRLHFQLDNSCAGSLGMVCGGNADVLLLPLQEVAWVQTALTWMEGARPGWLLLPLDGTLPQLTQDAALPGHAAVVEWAGQQALCVPLLDESRILLIGGGHVAAQTAQILTQLEYRYSVVDDRAEFAAAERFPGAEQTLTLALDQLEQQLPAELCPTANDAVCIMTRGHAADTAALRYALSTPAGYIGVMGSRRKREAMFAQLEGEGLTGIRERVCTPIGLSIGAQTPAEIAVSITAQLIQWRAARQGLLK